MYKAVKLRDIHVNKDLFKVLKSGLEIDKIISEENGLFPSTKTLVYGTPAAGKTSLMLEYLVALHKKGYKVLFISAEMGKTGITKYAKRIDGLSEIDILFTEDYDDQNMFECVQNVLNQSYHLVLIDSWNVLLNKVTILGYYEHELYGVIHHNTESKNIQKIPTSFLIIQQVTKSGVMSGKNYLKHMVDNVMQLSLDQNKNRLASFVKNRDGKVNVPLYFKFNDTNSISYSLTPFNKIIDPQKNKQDLALIRLAKQKAKIKGNADHIEFEELGMDKDEAWHLAKHLNDTIYLKPDKNGYRS